MGTCYQQGPLPHTELFVMESLGLFYPAEPNRE